MRNAITPITTITTKATKLVSWALIVALVAPGTAPAFAATAAPGATPARATAIVGAPATVPIAATSNAPKAIAAQPDRAATKAKFTPKFTLREAKPAAAASTKATAQTAQRTALPAGGATATQPQAAPAAPGPADLQETEDIVLTPAIRALATSLNNNPVQILNWVRNNIDYVPTWGSAQGAEMALQTRRANDIDSASLLIALYRAAGIPARYGQGTAEISASAAMNWVGGVGSAETALALLTQSGIPATSVVAGGTIAALRIERVWVEAYVDYGPSRGAINRSPNTWVQLDPAFKPATYTAGLDLRAGVGLDTAAFISQLQQGATLNQADSSATTLNRAAATASYTGYQTSLATYIAAQRPNATVGDVLGAKSIVAQNFPILVASLPYKTIGASTRYATLPDNLRWKFRYAVYASDADRAQDSPIAFVQRGLPALAGKRVSLSFAPATAADAQSLNAAVAANPLPASLQGYLYRLKAQLKLDGQLIGEGGSFALGTGLTAVSALYDPATGAWQPASPHQPAVGETIAVAVAPQGVAAEQLAASRDRLTATKTKLDARQFTGLSGEEVTAEPLYFAALAYAATVESNARLSQRAFNVVGTALPAVVRVGTRNETTLSGGVPQSVRFSGVALDVDSYSQTAVSATNNANASNAPREFQRVIGERASAFGHLLLEKLFTDNQHVGEAASALKALARANETGQKLFVVTSANAVTTLAQVGATADVKAQLDNGARAGKQGLVHQRDLTLGAWTGSGYLVEDNSTGSGNYEVQGQLTATLYPTGGWSALTLGGLALGAGNGNAVTDGLSTIFGQATGSYSSLSALLGDYRGAAWSGFAGAGAFTSSLWLAQTEPALNTQLGTGFGSLGLALAANSVTALTGAPLANSAPAITSTAITAGSVGQPYRYFATATDPENDPISFSLPVAPAGMSIAASGLITWPTPVRGTHSVTVRASDGRAFSEQRYALTISDVLPLALTLAVSPQYAGPGDAITITAATIGGRGSITRSLTVDGQAVTLDANGQARISNAAVGPHLAVATATDSDGTVTQRTGFGVRNPADTVSPTVAIVSPVTGSEIKAPIDIVGTASDSALVEWQVLISPAGQARYRLLAGGNSSVTNAILTRFDPTQLANGQWDILLRAVDANGQETSERVTYEVTGEMKIGQFSVSFLDLSIDAAGLPVSVSRTYDTRRKADSLDFGYGWTVDYQNIRVQKNLTTGIGWQVYNQGLLNTCIRPIGKRTVSIALPDGKLHRFDVAANPPCAPGAVPSAFTATFTPRADTTSTLTDGTSGSLQFQGDTVYDLDGQPYNPSQFTLTTVEGFVYTLDQNFGIKSVKEPNGNAVTFSANGIVHSAGLNLVFTRDSAGRISRVTDPNGQSIAYAYNDAGDLISVTDRSGGVSTMTYNSSHGLLTFTDPRGIQLAKNEYDADGRLVAQYDAAGAKLDMSARDIPGRRETVKDRRGNSTVYEYDPSGNVTRVTDALGGITAYTYDALGNELTKTDANGLTTTRTVDPATGNVYSETDPLGRTTAYAYNTINGSNGPSPKNIKQVTDAKGNVTNFGYDILDNPNSIKDANGAITAMQWNSGNLMRLTDAAGNATAYEYDSKGRRTKETDPLGAATAYTYDANGNITGTARTRTVNGTPVTLATSRTLDADGNTLTETDATGGVTRTTYNALKKVATSTDPAGRVTRYDYDERGRQTRVTYPDGTSEQTGYDANGNETSKTDLAGRVTTTDYDALNRPTKVTNPDGSTITSTYDAGGRVTQTTDERGNVTRHDYDAAGRRTKVTDALGNITQSAYDANGNLTSLTDALGNATSFEYDAANRRTKTTFAPVDGTASSVTVVYDALGRKSRETDEAGNVTQFGYDKLGRLMQVTDAVGGITAYGYDEAGNKLSQTDAKGNITKWEYDNLGRVTRRTLPEGMSETFAYDAAGNLSSQIDFLARGNTFVYDSLGRVTRKTTPEGRVIDTAYNIAGQVASITETIGGQSKVTRHTYDALDRLTKVEEPSGLVVQYQYDTAGNRSQVKVTDGAATRITAYSFDALNRLSQVTDADGRQTGYTYDANGNRSRITRANGVNTVFTYDSRKRLTGISHQKTDGSVIQALAYTLDAASRRTRIVESTPTEVRARQFSYDAAGKLTQETERVGTPASPPTDATAPTYQASYGYDSAGNRASKTETQSGATVTTTYGYDKNDRLITETPSSGSAITYTWDIAGNLTGKTEGTSTTQYSFDSENRLTQARVTTNNVLATTVDYDYDAAGNLIQRKVTDSRQNPAVTTITNLLIDKNQPYAEILEERDGSNQLSAQYVHADALDGPVARIQAGATGNSGVSFYLADALGSTRQLTDGAGTTTDTYRYDAWGNQQAQTGTTANAHRFTGEYLDAATGLVYLRARWMDARTGRFLGVDPYPGVRSKPLSLRKYLYANANPVSVKDPTGRFGIAETSTASDIAVSLSGVQTNFAFDFVSAKLEPDSFGASSIGWGIVLNLLPAAKFLPGIFRGVKLVKNEKAGAGWVRAIKGAEPKEVESASIIAERLGAHVLHRGKAAGSDLIIDSLRWELKVLTTGNPSQAANQIAKAVKKQGATHVALDVRNSPMTFTDVHLAIAEAGRKGARAESFMIVRELDIVFIYP